MSATIKDMGNKSKAITEKAALLTDIKRLAEDGYPFVYFEYLEEWLVANVGSGEAVPLYDLIFLRRMMDGKEEMNGYDDILVEYMHCAHDFPYGISTTDDPVSDLKAMLGSVSVTNERIRYDVARTVNLVNEYSNIRVYNKELAIVGGVLKVVKIR